MATPTSMSYGSITRPDYGGITLEAYPSTQARLSVEIQQATANSTASSMWTSNILPPTSSNVLRYTARVPLSTKTWYFRARHPTQPGYTAGVFTDVVKSMPTLIPVIQPRIVPQVNKSGSAEAPIGAVADWQASPTTRMKYGKVGTGLSDYGIQIFDQNAATVADFTGSKRILAVPVQPSNDSGTSITVDLQSGLTQQVRLTGTATVTLSNAINGGRYRVWFQQDATGSRPFPTIKGSNGDEIVMYTADTPPTLTATPGAFDLFEFEYRTNPSKRFTCMTLQTNVLLPTPSVLSVTNTSIGTTPTAHSVVMPASTTAGELLFMMLSYNNTTVTSTPSGWTEVAKNEATFTNPRTVIYAKVADGTEGGTTVTVNTAIGCTMAGQTYRIKKWLGAGAGWTVTSYATGTSVNPDSGSLTPGYTDRTLWVSAFAGGGNFSINSWPSNYTNTVTAISGGVTIEGLGSGYRTLYAASENPGQYVLASSQNWIAVTVAIEPPA